MTSPILVTGGTGTLGRLLVPRLRDAGCPVRVFTRRPPLTGPAPGVAYARGDLVKDEGIEAALSGVQVVVHCASAGKDDAEATRNLIRAALARTAPPHLVYVSVVGVDDVDYANFRAKRDSERAVTDSGLPWTTLRATQFYDLLLRGARLAARLPLIPVPAGLVVQPVDPDEVAARLTTLALAEPAGRVPDLAGPQVAEAADLLRTYLRHTARRRPVIRIRLPGLSRIRAGALLPPNAPRTATRTWEEFLTAHLP